MKMEGPSQKSNPSPQELIAKQIDQQNKSNIEKNPNSEEAFGSFAEAYIQLENQFTQNNIEQDKLKTILENLDMQAREISQRPTKEPVGRKDVLVDDEITAEDKLDQLESNDGLYRKYEERLHLLETQASKIKNKQDALYKKVIENHPGEGPFFMGLVHKLNSLFDDSKIDPTLN